LKKPTGQPSTTSSRVATQTNVVVSQPTLAIACTREHASVGDRIQYRIRYANTDANALTHIQIQCRLPKPLQFIEASDGQYNEQEHQISWSMDTLHAGEVGENTFVVRVDASATPSKTIECVATMDCVEAESVRVIAAPLTTTAPELTLRHAVSAQQASPGDVLLHTLEYECQGSSMVPRARLKADIPASCEFVSASAGGKVDRRGRMVKWPLGTLQPGVCDSVLFTVRVSDVVPTGTTMVQSLSRIEAHDLAKPIESASPKTKLHGTAVLHAQLESSTQQAAPGTRVTLRMVVTNTGNTHAHSVQALLRPMGKTRVVSPANGRMVSNGATEWDMGDVHAGASATLEWEVELDSPFPSGDTSLEPVISITSAGTDPITVRAPDILVSAQPLLRILLEVDRTVATPGDLMTYHARIANIGTANARSVIATLELPPHVDPVPEQSMGQFRAPKRHMVYRIPALPVGGEEDFVVAVRLSDTFPAGITELTARTRASSPNAPDVQSEVVSTRVEAETNVQFDITPNATTVQPGDTLRFEARVINAGLALVEGMIVRIPLPDGLTVTGQERGITVDKKTGSLVWSLGDVRAKQQSTTAFETRIEPSFPAGENQVVLNTDVQWTGGSFQRASKALLIAANPVLAMALQCPKGNASPGDPFHINVRFQNEGNARASHCELTLTLDPNTSITTTTSNVRTDKDKVIVDVGSLNAGESGTFQLEGVFAPEFPAGETTVSASVALRCSEGASIEAEGLLGTVSAAAKMTMLITVDETEVVPGDTLSLAVECTNGGNSPTGSFTVECVLPDSLTAIQSTGGDSRSTGDAIQWVVNDLLAGQSTSLAIQIQTAGQFPAGDTSLQLPFELLGNDGLHEAFRSPAIRVEATPMLAISLEANPLTAAPGDVVAYRTIIKNAGTADAQNVVTSLQLPNHVEVIAELSVGKYQPTRRDMALRIPTLPVGAQEEFEVSVRLHDTFPVGTTEITAQSKATSPNSLTVQSEMVTTRVNAETDVQLELAPTTDTARPGETLRFEAHALNAGKALVEGMTVRIPLPDGLTVTGQKERGLTYDKKTDSLLWSVGNIRAKQQSSISFETRIEPRFQAGESRVVLTSEAQWIGGSLPGVSKPLQIVANPALRMALQCLGGAVSPGDPFHINVRFQNEGDASATHGVLTIDLDPRAMITTTSTTARMDAGRVVVDVGSLQPNDKGSVQLEGVFAPEFPTGETPITAHAALTCSENISVDAETLLGTVSAASKVVLNLAIDEADVLAGDRLSVALDCTNSGNSPTGRLTVECVLPESLTAIESTGGDERTTDDMIQWVVHDLPAGQTASLALVVQTAQLYAAGDTSLQLPFELSGNEGVQQNVLSPPVNVRAKPALEITLESTATTAAPGEVVTFQAIIANTGSADARNVAATLALPDYVEPLITQSTGRYSTSKRDMTLRIPTLAAGERERFDVSVQLNDTFPVGTTELIVQTEARSPNATSVQSEPTIVQVDALADVKLTLTPNVESAHPGDRIQFMAKAGNSGKALVQDLTVRIPLPDGLTVKANDRGFSRDRQSGEFIWTLGDLRSNQEIKASFTVQVETTFPAGENQISMNLDASWEGGGTQGASSSLLILTAPTLAVEMRSATKTAKPGDSFQVSIRTYNNGNACATGCSLILSLPPGVKPINTPANALCERDRVVYEIKDMGPGESESVRFEGGLDETFPAGETAVTLGALIQCAEGSTSESEATVAMVSAASKIGMSVSADRSEGQPGDTVSFRMVCKNHGNAAHRPLTVRAVIPDELQVITASGGDERTREEGVLWHVHELPPGGHATLGVVCRLLESFPAGKTQIQFPFEFIVADSVQSATQSPTLIVHAKPEPVIALSVDSEILPFDRSTRLLLTVTNDGNAPANNATLELSLPKGLACQEASDQGVITPNGRAIRWTIGSLDVGSSSVDRWIDFVPGGAFAPGLNKNSAVATLRGHGFDVVKSDKLDLIIDAQPTISLGSTFSPEHAMPGEAALVTIHYQNIGHAEAECLHIVNPLPPRTEFVAASNKGRFDEVSNAVHWEVRRLSAGASGECQLSLQLDTEFPNGHTIITNSCNATADQNPVVLSEEQSVTIQAIPTITASLEADRDAVRPGDDLSITISCYANGSAPASDVVLDLVIPAFVTVQETSTEGVLNPETGCIRWSLGMLRPGQTFATLLQLKMNAIIPAGIEDLPLSLLANSVETGATEGSVCAVRIDSAPDLILSLAGDKTEVSPEETLLLDVDLINKGTTDCSGVVMTLPLPGGIQADLEQSMGDWIIDETGLRWNVGPLPVGAHYNQPLQLRVTADFPAGRSPINLSAKATSVDGTAGGSCDYEMAVLAVPMLHVSSKASPETASVGETVTYTFTIENVGKASARAVRAVGHLPHGLELIDCSHNGVMGAVTPSQVVWMIPSVDIAECVELTVQTEMNLQAATPTTSMAGHLELSSPDLTDRVVSERAAVGLEQVPESMFSTQLVVIGHDVAWGDSDIRSVQVMPGQTIPLELVVSNQGKAPISSLIGTLTAGEPFVEFACPDADVEAVSPLALTWQLDELSTSATRRLQTQVTLDSVMPAGTHTIPLRALVTTPADEEREDAVSLVVTAAPTVSLALSTDRTETSPGDEMILTVQYSVNGYADANDLSVSLPLPKGCKPIGVSDGGEIIRTRQKETIRWTPGLFAVGDEGLLRCTVLLDPKVFDEDANLCFEALATAKALSDITSHPMNLAVVPKALLTLTVTADRMEAIPGERIGYTLRVENVGFATIKGVTLSNPLPPRCRYASGTEGGTYDDLLDAVVWTLPAIASGGSVSVGWTAELDLDFPYGESLLTNMVVARMGDDELVESDDVSTRIVSEPILESHISVEPQRARPGDHLVGTVTWKNVGMAYADRAKGLIKLPKGCRAVSASDQGQIQRKGAVIQWKIASIDCGAEGQTSFELVVDKAFAPGETTLPIQLEFTSRNGASCESSVGIVVESCPRLDLQATVNATEASPGALLHYTLALANRGEVPATNALLHFPLPPFCTVQHTTHTHDLKQNDRELIWQFSSLNAGFTGSVEVQLQVTGDLAAGETMLEVTPSLHADGALAANDVAPLTTLVHAAPQVRASVDINKDQAVPGDELTIHLVLANDGDADAPSTGLLFPLPPRLDFVGSDGAPVRYQRAKRIVEFVAGDLAPGQEVIATIRTQLESSFPAGETTLGLRGRYGVEGGPSEWTDTVKCMVTALPSLTPEIALERDTANPNDSIRCKARIENDGNAIAKDCVLLTILPEQLTLVDARGGVFDGISRTVTWPIKKLDVNATREFPFVVQLTGAFAAGSTQLPIHLETNCKHIESKTAETSLWVDASPKLQLHLDTDVDDATPNSDIRYHLSLRNEGNAAAEGVTLELALPPRSILLDGGPDAIHKASAGSVQWPLPSLDIGESFDAVAAVRLADTFPYGTTTLASRASVRANNASACPDASVEIPVTAAPVLDVIASIDCDEPTPGGTLTVELMWRNAGDASATNASVSCQAAPYTRATKVSNGGEIDRRGVSSWNLGNVPAGGSGKVTLDLVVSKEVPPGDHNLAPTLMVTCNEIAREERPLPVVSLETTSDLVVEVTSETSVATAAIGTRVSTRTTGSDNRVAQEKTQEVTIGALISFQLEIANRGNAAADDTEIRHDLPKGAIFVSATDNGLYDATKHCVVWQLGRVSAGQEGLIRKTVVRFGE
jgi:uncharacterized repeat protein (TIGR01451 family)